MKFVKWLFGVGLLAVRVYSRDAAVKVAEEKATRLEQENLNFRERVIPSLRRELMLEQAENDMLKQKLALWRMEIKKDQAVTASQIPRLEEE